jgi:hypothetical protein
MIKYTDNNDDDDYNNNNNNIKILLDCDCLEKHKRQHIASSLNGFSHAVQFVLLLISECE